MDIARIKDGVVVNIEVADQDWLDAHAGDPEFTFVPYTPDAPARVGDTHDPDAGFVQPEPVLTVTQPELDALVADEVAKAEAAAKP